MAATETVEKPKPKPKRKPKARKPVKFRTFLGPEAVKEAQARADRRRTETLAARQKRIETRQGGMTKRTKHRKAPMLAMQKGKAESGFWSADAVKSRQATLGGALEKGIGAAAAIGQALIQGDDAPAPVVEDAPEDEAPAAPEAEGLPMPLILGGAGAVLVVIIIVVVMMSSGKKKAA